MKNLIGKIANAKFYFFVFFYLMATLSLEGSGWGIKKEFVKDSIHYSQIYFDLNGIKFEAFIPNYIHTSLINGEVSLKGMIDKSGFFIFPELKSILKVNSNEDFFSIIQNANPDYFAILVPYAEKLGAMAAVDLIHKNNEDYWRIILINDRIIKMATTEQNEHLRLYFFDSMKIKKSRKE